MSFSAYTQFLEQHLSPTRLAHSHGVMAVMGQLAEWYGLEPEPAQTAGLLHDAARDMPRAQMLALAQEAGLSFRYDCERLPLYLHGPVGAYWIQQYLGITDLMILDAVATHTQYDTVSEAHSRFAWCLRLADLLAPSRPWIGMRKLQHIVRSGSLETAALLQVGWLIEYLGESGVPVHPNFYTLYRELQTRSLVQEDFFARW